MIRDISFGKVDGYGNGRKMCELVINFGFTEFDNQAPYFSVCGELWNNLHTDIIRGGQCVGELYMTYFADSSFFKTIYELWQKYHLRDIDSIPADDLAVINSIINGEVQGNWTYKNLRRN